MATDKYIRFDWAAEKHAYDEHINAVMIQNDVISTAMKEELKEEPREKLKQLSKWPAP